jgi:hypothetical protein
LEMNQFVHGTQPCRKFDDVPEPHDPSKVRAGVGAGFEEKEPPEF